MTRSGRAASAMRFRDYLNRRVLTMLALGFSSGLPFLLVGNTFGYWLRDEGTSAGRHRLSFLGRHRLFAEIPLGAAAGPHRRAIAGRAGPAARLDGAGADHRRRRLVAMALGRHRPWPWPCWAPARWWWPSPPPPRTPPSTPGGSKSPRDTDELGLLTSGYTFGYRGALLVSEAVILPIAQRIGWNASYVVYGAAHGHRPDRDACWRAEPRARRSGDGSARKRRRRSGRPRGFFDAVAGPFIAFFKTHGAIALLMLLAISLFQLPNFVSGPMYNPMYVDLGLTKDMVGAVRGSFGLVGVFLGVAAGGYLSAAAGTDARADAGRRAARCSAPRSMPSLPYAHDPLTFAAIMVLDNFGIALAGITLVAYMSIAHQPGLYRDAICASVLDLCPGRESSSRAFPARRWKACRPISD